MNSHPIHPMNLHHDHQILNAVMSVSCYCTSCSSLLSAVITSSESEFRVRGELRLICLAARPAEYEEVTCRPARGDLMDFAKVQRVGKKLSLMETCHIVFCVHD